MSANRRSWEGVVRRIEGRFTALVPDVPGRGDSGTLPAAHALSRFRKPIARYILERRVLTPRSPRDRHASRGPRRRMPDPSTRERF